MKKKSYIQNVFFFFLLPALQRQKKMKTLKDTQAGINKHTKFSLFSISLQISFQQENTQKSPSSACLLPVGKRCASYSHTGVSSSLQRVLLSKGSACGKGSEFFSPPSGQFLLAGLALQPHVQFETSACMAKKNKNEKREKKLHYASFSTVKIGGFTT